MRLEEILKDEPEMTPVAMGDGVLYQMVVNDEFTLHLRTFNETSFFFLYGKVGELPEGKRRQELLEELLESNLFCQGTGDGFFSWHRETNTIVLMANFDSAVATYQQYKTRLQTFVNFIAYWQKKLKTTPEDSKNEDVLKLMSQKKRVFFI